MKLRCPHCGHSAELLDFTSEDAARKAVFMAADLPRSLGKPLFAYIGLFKPSSRALSWERVLSLLTELKRDIDAGRIERHSRIWPAPEGLWHQALTTTLEQADQGKLKLPLKNHGYLYEIISSAQSSAEAREEQKLEEKRQQAQHRAKKPAPKPQTEQSTNAGKTALNDAFSSLGIKSKFGESDDR